MSPIRGHRIWWTCDAADALQAGIRWGFTLGLQASTLVADPLVDVVLLAAAWALLPSAVTWTRGAWTRHEQGPVVRFEEATA